MSQVKNLRAMFENKVETSPPDRGRASGVLSTNRQAGGSASSSPRPLSKVRTNFVAIENNGRMILQREQSGESELPGRPMSHENTDIDASKTCAESHKPRPDDNSVDHTSPKSLPSDEACDAAVQSVSEPRVFADKSNTAMAAGKASMLGSTNQPVEQEVAGATLGLQNDELASRKTTTAPSASSKVSTEPHVSRAAQPSRERMETKSPGKRTPASTPRTLKTGAKEKAPTSSASNTPVSRQTKGQGVSISKGKAPSKPLSKPIGLPLSQTAPNLLSESRVSGPRQKLAVQAGRQRKHIPISQSANRASLPGPSLSAASSNYQGSATSRVRPSLGPPPNRPASSENNHRKQPVVDDKFLARMMRPTQSSSCKATERSVDVSTKKRQQRQTAGPHRNTLAGIEASKHDKKHAAPLKERSITDSPAEDTPPRRASVQRIRRSTSHTKTTQSSDGPVSPVPTLESSTLDHDKTIEPEPVADTDVEDISQCVVESTRNEGHSLQLLGPDQNPPSTVEAPVGDTTDTKLDLQLGQASDSFSRDESPENDSNGVTTCGETGHERDAQEESVKPESDLDAVGTSNRCAESQLPSNIDENPAPALSTCGDADISDLTCPANEYEPNLRKDTHTDNFELLQLEDSRQGIEQTGEGECRSPSQQTAEALIEVPTSDALDQVAIVSAPEPEL